jgi:hypothetical protein
MMQSVSPILSVVLATYDRHRLLEGCIDSLLGQTADPASFEIIVVDNSPDPAAAANFGRRYAGMTNVRYLLEPVAGVNNARNKGLAQARGRIVALVDDDAVAARDWMQQIVAAFEAYGARAGCVGGRIVPRWTAPRPPWLHDKLLGYLSIVDWGGPIRELGPGEWIASCNMAFDREALLAAGGFPTSLGRKGSEAVLLSNSEPGVYERVGELGKAVIYAPAAVVEHVIDPARLTRAWMRRRIAWQVVSDCLKDEATMAANASAAARRAQKRLGASHDTENARTFYREHDAVKDLMLGLLSGRIGLNPSGSVRPRLQWPASFTRLRRLFGRKPENK